MSETQDTATVPTPDDLPANSELAYRMGLSLGRLEGLIDGMLSRFDRRAAELVRALDARVKAEAERDATDRTE